jgi:Kdo2-lipid IVA lauroyltransferase/acyltransferase
MSNSAPLRKFRYVLEAALFFFFIGLFRLLGLDGASAVGGFIGRTILYRLPVANRGRLNLRAAYPDRPAAEIEKILREVCDNLGRTVAEYAHLDKFDFGGPEARVEVVGSEIAKAAIERGKGAICYSGHFANWELMAFAGARLFSTEGEVYRPVNNPYVDKWLVEQRRKNGPANQIPKGASGTRRLFTLLRRGQAACLLVDQKTNEGVPVLYFGRDAMTTPAPAAMALRLDCALVPASIERKTGSRFLCRVHPTLQFTASGDYDRDVVDLTALLTRKIEDIVRERPSQWLWIHRRWPTGRAQDQIRGKRSGVRTQEQLPSPAPDRG